MSLHSDIQQLIVTFSRVNALYQRFEQQTGRNVLRSQVLYAIYVEGLTTQKQIRELYELPKQTVHNIVASFARLGYLDLASNQENRREKTLRLTESGVAYAEAELAPFLELERRIAQRLGPEAYRALVAASEAYADAMEQEIEAQNCK